MKVAAVIIALGALAAAAPAPAADGGWDEKQCPSKTGVIYLVRRQEHY